MAQSGRLRSPPNRTSGCLTVPHSVLARADEVIEQASIMTVQEAALLRRQHHSDFGEFAWFSKDLDRAAMLLDDDVVTDGETKPGTLSGRLRREEWIEHLLLHVSRNTGSVVANPNFHVVTEVLGRGSEGGLLIVSPCLRFAL